VIATLLFLTPLFGSEAYLLPDDYAMLNYNLSQKIKRAHKVTIVTQSFQHPSLNRALLKHLSSHNDLLLITADQPSAAYFAKYKNTQVYLPPNTFDTTHFKLNFMIIDQSDVCFFSTAITQEKFKKESAYARCSNDEEEIAFALKTGQLLSQRFLPYFNP